MTGLTRIPVRRDVAMTGEITLRGKVLPIGGVKEKLLAAHRAGIHNIILPRDNQKDLADIPANIQDDLRIQLVDNMDQVLDLALERKIETNPSLTPESEITSSFETSPSDTDQEPMTN